jgi:uncharacterized protein (DUF2236 family)
MGINEQMDLGLFGPQSVVWKFHSSKVALVGGIRALMIQALEPRAMAAVEAAGGYKADPVGRLARTIEFIQTVSFAQTKEAMSAISKINSIHSRINGVDPITGMNYDASDPLQLAYVHNALVESIAVVHELYDPYTSISEINAYIVEMSSVARLLGVRDADLPQQYQSLKRWVESFDTLISTEVAREAVGYLKSPLMPFPLESRPQRGHLFLERKAIRDVEPPPQGQRRIGNSLLGQISNAFGSVFASLGSDSPAR